MTFPPIPDQSHTFTGSWADSTHSVVWMTRSGKQRPLISAHRPASRVGRNFAGEIAKQLGK